MHVDFVITNPSHHVKIVDPVAAALMEQGHSCRVLSACEVRGWATPASPIGSGAPVVQLIPRLRRGSPSTSSGDDDGGSRAWLKELVWKVLLAPSLRRALRRQTPDVVAVCNDIAFPGYRILDWYREAGIRRVLIPEGIRFVPQGNASSGRIDAIAAWGPSSVEYFLREGFAPEAVRATGSPRHDTIQRELEQLKRAATGSHDRTIALITNPVDGGRLRTCTTEEKLGVVTRFVREAAAANEAARIVVRTHPGEDADGYREALAEFLGSGQVELNPPGDLFALLAATPVVVVLGSTVGIEALLADADLYVLPIPGRGYLHDFVERGGAIGLSDPMPPGESSTLFGSKIGEQQRRAYLDTQLSNRGQAAAAVAALLDDVAHTPVPR